MAASVDGGDGTGCREERYPRLKGRHPARMRHASGAKNALPKRRERALYKGCRSRSRWPRGEHGPMQMTRRLFIRHFRKKGIQFTGNVGSLIAERDREPEYNRPHTLTALRCGAPSLPYLFACCCYRNNEPCGSASFSGPINSIRSLVCYFSERNFQ